jgi:hypothetical protein
MREAGQGRIGQGTQAVVGREGGCATAAAAAAAPEAPQAPACADATIDIVGFCADGLRECARARRGGGGGGAFSLLGV